MKSTAAERRARLKADLAFHQAPAHAYPIAATKTLPRQYSA
jgi:hypothetical protein